MKRGKASPRLSRDRHVRKAAASRPERNSDERALLHELKVHQVELEAQNAQLRQTQSELAAALARYTDLYNSSPVSYLTLDTDGFVVDANATASHLFHLRHAQLIGADIRKLVAADHVELVSRMLSSPHPKEQRRPLEVRLPDSRGGIERNVQFIAVRMKNFVRLAIVDVTEVRRLERAVTQASESERERLRADLHDGLGQELTGLSLSLAALLKEANSLALPGADELEQLRVISSNAIMTCRTIVHGLSPVAKSGGGLIAALETLAKRPRRDGDPSIEMSVQERFPIGLDEAAADHVYRIAQETINNALKHGHATIICMAVTVLIKTIVLEIHDNGRSARTASSSVKGHGLEVMRFRARKIHGKLSIKRSSRGTRIRFTCPNGALGTVQQSHRPGAARRTPPNPLRPSGP